MIPGWIESNVQTLFKNKEDFKSEACRAFEKYHASGLGRMNFQLLEHVMDDLWFVNSQEYWYAGLYGAIRKSFYLGDSVS